MAGKKGRSGRRPNEKPVSESLKKILGEIDEAHGLGRTHMESVCMALLDKAQEGDVAAIKELLDRVEGKVKQQTEVSGNLDSRIELIKRIAKGSD